MIHGRVQDVYVLVEADALAKLLGDLAQAAGYCPDYFVEDVPETVERAKAALRELDRQ